MAGISEAITQIKKAESDADSLVEQSTVDAKAMIDDAEKRGLLKPSSVITENFRLNNINTVNFCFD